MAKTKDFAEVIRRKLAANPQLANAVEDESFNATIAFQVYELRKAAGLTQKELAEKVGTYQTVIARMENADYDGHSLAMLRKIARALDRQVRIEFSPYADISVAGRIKNSAKKGSGDTAKSNGNTKLVKTKNGPRKR